MERLPRYLSNTTESLPDKFQPEDFIENTKRRKRSFTPRALLLILIQLVGTMNKEGYDHALIKVFGVESAPSKSALSWFRNQISFNFFKDIFTRAIKKFDAHRPTFNGMII